MVEEDGNVFLILRKDDDDADYSFLKKSDNSWIKPSEYEIKELQEIYKNDFDGYYNLIETVEYQKCSNIFDKDTPDIVRESLEKAYSFLFERFKAEKFNKKFATFNLSALKYFKIPSLGDLALAKYSQQNNSIVVGEGLRLQDIIHECWHAFSAKPSVLSYLLNYSSVGLSTYRLNSVKGEAINEGVTQYLTEQSCEVDKDRESYVVLVRIAKMMEKLFGDDLYQAYFEADRKLLYDSAKRNDYEEGDLKSLFFISDALLKWEQNSIVKYNKAFDKEENKDNGDTNIFDVILSKYKIKNQSHLANVELILLKMMGVLLNKTIDENPPGEELNLYVNNIIKAFEENLIFPKTYENLDIEFFRRKSIGLEEVERKFCFLKTLLDRKLKLKADNDVSLYVEKDETARGSI